MTCHRHSTSCGLGVYVRTDKPSFSRGCETMGSDAVNVVVRLWWCTSSSDLSPDGPGSATTWPQCAQRDITLIHISEPTRLGMISYAVFCLKKKKKLHR